MDVGRYLFSIRHVSRPMAASWRLSLPLGAAGAPSEHCLYGTIAPSGAAAEEGFPAAA